MIKYIITLAILYYIIPIYSKPEYRLVATKVIDNKHFDFILNDSIKIVDTIYSERKSDFYVNDFTYTINYNALNNQLYLYQIDTSFKLYKRISLSNTDANQNEGITDLYLHNLDSIFIITQDNFYIINSKGDKLFKKQLNNIKKRQEFTYGNIYNNYNLYFYKNKLHFFALNNKGPQNFLYYKKPIDATYNFVTNTITENKIYQSLLLQKNIYGLVRNPCKISHDSLSIISFYNDPNIYVCNYDSRKTDTVGGKSAFQEYDIEHLDKKYINDKDVQYKHFMLSPWYFSITWDPYRKQYYRMFINGINEKNDQGLFNSFKDKHVILMVFDEHFELLKEKDIGLYKDFGTGYLTITPKCVYIKKISNHTIYEPIVLMKIEFNDN